MIINCTPHDVVLCDVDGKVVTLFEKSGTVPRVEEENVRAIDFSCPTLSNEENYDYLDFVNNRAIRKQLKGVVGLPRPKAGIVYVVSALVFNASDRKDLIAPDTGPESAVRNEKGHIIGVQRFIVR